MDELEQYTKKDDVIVTGLNRHYSYARITAGARGRDGRNALPEATGAPERLRTLLLTAMLF